MTIPIVSLYLTNNNNNKNEFNLAYWSFFYFCLFLLLLLPSHAIVHVNSVPNNSFYFNYGLSPVTNYYSTLSDVSPLDKKGGHAAFTQWTNTFSLYQKTLLLEWFGWQISEHVSQLFRSQCVKVTSYCLSLRSEGQARSRLAGRPARWLSFQSPVCESLESCSSRNCRVSLVCRAIQRRLWNRAGPWKYSRWKQHKTERKRVRR